MTREQLRQHVAEAMEEYAALSYDQAEALVTPVKYHRGNPGGDDFYQVDIRVLQKFQSDTEDWIEVTVSVDDGLPRGGWLARRLGAVTPESGSLVFHRDGRVEKLLPE